MQYGINISFYNNNNKIKEKEYYFKKEYIRNCFIYKTNIAYLLLWFLTHNKNSKIQIELFNQGIENLKINKKYNDIVLQKTLSCN